MKVSILFTLILTLLAPMASQAKISDFHSMIVESQEAKAALGQQLKENVKTLKTTVVPTEKIVIRESEDTVEQVASPSAPLKIHKNKSLANKVEKDTMKRVSQEFQESED
jgi:hypothetical protein